MSHTTEAIDSIGSTMRELKADEAAIEKVQKALHDTLRMLDDDPFKYMATIQQHSFGTDQAATTLAYHHGLAHQVMTETLQGIKQDIEAFAKNLVKARDIIKGTDESAGSELKKRHDLLSAFDYQHHHSRETSAHTHARNHQRNPWAPPVSTENSSPAGVS